MLTKKEEGQQAAVAYYRSQGYGALTRHVKAEDAIKLFLPPVVEMLVQYEAPYPKDRKEWIAGFKEEQARLIVELDIKPSP